MHSDLTLHSALKQLGLSPITPLWTYVFRVRHTEPSLSTFGKYRSRSDITVVQSDLANGNCLCYSTPLCLFLTYVIHQNTKWLGAGWRSRSDCAYVQRLAWKSHMPWETYLSVSFFGLMCSMFVAQGLPCQLLKKYRSRSHYIVMQTDLSNAFLPWFWSHFLTYLVRL